MDNSIERVVISLEGSDRRSSFFAQPMAREFRTFDAFDGRKEASPWFDVARFERHYGNSPTPGQVGCATSHWLVVSEFAERPGGLDDWLLVNEDDTEFLPGTESILSAAASRGKGFDAIVLSDGWSRSRRKHLRRMVQAMRQLSLLAIPLGWQSGHLIRIGRYSGVAWSTGLYLISRRGARKLVQFVLSSGGQCYWTADDWGRFRAEARLDVALASPSIALSEGVSTTAPNMQVADVDSRVPLKDRVLTLLAIRTRLRATRLASNATWFDIQCRARKRVTQRRSSGATGAPEQSAQ